ncbi:MAG: hypothetical protein A3K59_08505 [Euryarchaeota archaeon RBG_19FT_COMBO_69_17]|nr:MAG: hypothetical protein A3K59_08505 [Euryarchaeota archaeon RBG_19FT_COMBO_69_17]
MPSRCPVCGVPSEEAVCPRCGTILAPGRAICPRCGKLFSGAIAACDACGSSIRPRVPPAKAPDAAVAALLAVPGITEARARELAARGFRDFSDIVRLALPEKAVRMGLHHAIARKALLSAMAPGGPADEAAGPCPICGTPWRAGEEACRACGTSSERTLDREALEAKVAEVTGELVDLADDPDFREMPSDVREELLLALGGLDEAEILRDEYRRQIDAWRRKGFDVRPLDALLAGDPGTFQERSVRLIRAQMMKKAESGSFRCPLCEVRIPSTAEECGNCGARFG